MASNPCLNPAQSRRIAEDRHARQSPKPVATLSDSPNPTAPSFSLLSGRSRFDSWRGHGGGKAWNGAGSRPATASGALASSWPNVVAAHSAPARETHTSSGMLGQELNALRTPSARHEDFIPINLDNPMSSNGCLWLLPVPYLTSQCYARRDAVAERHLDALSNLRYCGRILTRGLKLYKDELFRFACFGTATASHIFPTSPSCLRISSLCRFLRQKVLPPLFQITTPASRKKSECVPTHHTPDHAR